MKFILLAYIVAAIIGVYFWNHIPKFTPPPVPPGRDSSMWNKGRAIYNYKCLSCHNANPDYPGTVGPALRGVSEELIRERLKNGKGNMPPFPKLERLSPALREYLR